MDTREDIPRVPVDTFDDLDRIKRAFTSSMLEILEAKLAALSSGAEKDAVRAHLLAWRDRTFDLAKPNLRINGLPYSAHPTEADETEPFDEALDRRIWSLQDEKIVYDKTIADRRRKTPVEVQRVVESWLVRQRGLEEVPEDVEGDEEMEDVDDIPNLSELSKTHQETLALVADLQTKTPVLLQKVANIKRVEEDIARLAP